VRLPRRGAGLNALFRLSFPAFGAALAAACVGIKTYHVVTGEPGPVYAGSVAVYMEGAPLPERYEEVALLQAEGAGGNLATLLPKLQARAAALGCDAIVLVKIDQGAGTASATGVAVRVKAPAPTSPTSAR
jgi:hypothetical protein